MIVTVTLNPALDLTLEVPGWEPGAVNRAAAVRRVIGGKGINVSRMLRELDVETTVLTIVGHESLDVFRRLARLAEVPIVYINVAGELRTNVHVVDPQDGRTLKVNQPGIPMDESAISHFKLLLRQQLRRSAMVTMGGSLPPGCDTGTYAELTALAHHAGVPVIIDGEGPSLLAALEEKPLLVKPNRVELESTLGRKLESREDILGGARELIERGARGIVVTDGANAVYAAWENHVYIAHPPPVTVHGSTGAGDAFTAGLAAGLYQGKEFEAALRLAIACGTASCMVEEGMLGNQQTVRDMEKRILIERKPV